MATILRVLSISSQRGLTLTSMPQFLVIQRLFCNNKLLNPISNPLVAKLLQVPNSRIKSALDSEDTSALKSFGDSWESLVISLRSTSPQKAHLVIFKFQSFFLSFYSPLCTVWSLRKCEKRKEKWKFETFIIKWKVNFFFFFWVSFYLHYCGGQLVRIYY